MDVSNGCISTTSGESWHSFCRSRMPGSAALAALAHTRVGRFDPFHAVEMLVPAAMAWRTVLIGAGSAERKKAL